MSMLNRPANGTDTGEIVASTRDYESAQKTVSKLIAQEVPARDIAIVGQGVRTVERVTGKLGYAAAARSGAINGVLIGLFLSAILVLGNPEVPIQLFVGFVLIGVAVGMLLSLVTYAIVRRRRDFASVTQFAADHYEVTVQPASLAKARQALGAGRTAPVRPPVNLDEPPRYGERIPQGGAAPEPAEPVVPPRPADPAPPAEPTRRPRRRWSSRALRARRARRARPGDAPVATSRAHGARVTIRIDVPLPSGIVPVSAEWASGSRGATVIVAHGAGAGMDHPFLTGLTDALAAEGYSTLRFTFPYLEQGRRMPGPAAHAVATWRAAVAFARQQDPPASVWAAGKSYGGRMASMAAAEGLEVDGLVYLGYPFHPPGRPDKPRQEHLPAVAAPQLFVEGDADPFIQPVAQFEQAVATCRDARVHWVEGGGHSFEVKGRKRPASEIGASLAPVIAAFVEERRPR